MTRCERCSQGDRRPEQRARLAKQDGSAALVLDVPVEVCPVCDQVWLTVPVPKQLDLMFDKLLRVGRRRRRCIGTRRSQPDDLRHGASAVLLQ